ncbi:uncharacterized protein LOC135391621 [Ornithodoros turicata]|uniref:uncharacterized protein LOC135391621 n=1 Tax=Ornithodoros turicata TaxID=34597 RepID=UPI003139B3A3
MRVHVTHIQTDDISISKDLQKFWDLEHLGIKQINELSSLDILSDNPVLQRFRETTCLTDKRYVVRLPWKGELTNLGSNRDLARRRLDALTRTLRSDPDLLEEYDRTIRQYLKDNHAERVPIEYECSNSCRVYYRPRHAVIRRDRETTKVRIVFDFSSKAPGLESLNDLSDPGPNLNPDIYSTPPSTQGELPPVEAWLVTRVPFESSSPFLLCATIYHHLQLQESAFPSTIERLKERFYVDDLLTGACDLYEATRVFEETLQIFDAASMPVRKALFKARRPSSANLRGRRCHQNSDYRQSARRHLEHH